MISMGIIVEDETYVVLEDVGKCKSCTPESWLEFIKRKQEELKLKNENSSPTSSEKLGTKSSRLSFA